MLFLDRKSTFKTDMKTIKIHFFGYFHYLPYCEPLPSRNVVITIIHLIISTTSANISTTRCSRRVLSLWRGDIYTTQLEKEEKIPFQSCLYSRRSYQQCHCAKNQHLAPLSPTVSHARIEERLFLDPAKTRSQKLGFDGLVEQTGDNQLFLANNQLF